MFPLASSSSLCNVSFGLYQHSSLFVMHLVAVELLTLKELYETPRIYASVSMEMGGSGNSELHGRASD